MLQSVAFPIGWFTAKEVKLAAATLRAYVNDNILEVDRSCSPMKYRVIPTDADLNAIFQKYPHASFVLVHSDNFITIVKQKQGQMVALLDELDGNGELKTAPFNISPTVKYVNIYQDRGVTSINL